MRRLTVSGLLLCLVIVAAQAQEKPDALAMYLEGRYEEAIQVCLAEIEALPRNMDSYVVMGWSLIELERYEEALEQAQKALSVSPYDPRVAEIAGESLFHLGENQEALKHFEQYVFIAPTGGRIDRVYYFMGEIFIRLGQYNNADIALSTALHFDESVARWWSRLGYAREMGEQYQWAMEAYENALRLNPNLMEARDGLASVKKKLGGE